MAYAVILKPSAEREFRAFDRRMRERLLEKFEQLAEQPRGHGAVKLTGEDLYRIRTGDIRIVYAIQDDRLLVLVVRIAKRDDVYRK